MLSAYVSSSVYNKRYNKVMGYLLHEEQDKEDLELGPESRVFEGSNR